MKITNFTDFKNEIVNKGKTFIFKIEYDNPSDVSIPAPLNLQRTPRGIDIDYAIPNNHSMIYKYVLRESNKTDIEMFRFKGFETFVEMDLCEDVWWYITKDGLHTVTTHYISPDIWYLDKWGDFILETVPDNFVHSD